jgi:omega-amidase
VNLAAVQMDIAWHGREANFEKARRMAEKAREGGADILVLPEMFATGFSMDTSVTAEPLDGPTPSFLRSLALDSGMTVAGGFVLADEGKGPRNVSLAVDPQGRDLALYAKIHQIPILDEHLHYEPGTKACTFTVKGLQTACLICYDLRFPELFRHLADECGLILVIASWPAARQTHWDVLLRARAIENQCFVAGVNRVGQGGGNSFTGGSAIFDPLGTILAHAGKEETLLTASIDPNQVEEVRAAMPFLKDRKPHLFT